MSREYVPLFLDFNESTQDLTDEECGRLVRAIIDYANGREYENRLVGAEKIAFRFLKGAIDRNQAISEVRAKAGSSKKKTEQNATNENKTEQTEQMETDSINKKRITKNKIQKTKNDIDERDRSERFEKFWSAYPRKENKQKAIAAFEKVNPDDQMLDAMLRAIERQKTSSQWQEEGGRFIPHPTTWLNGRRWEDEVQTAQPRGKAQAVQQYEQRDYNGLQDELAERFIRMTEPDKFAASL